MKLLVMVALLAAPVFAHDCVDLRSARREAARARATAMRAVRQARAQSAREMARARTETRRAIREALRDVRTERRWRM